MHGGRCTRRNLFLTSRASIVKKHWADKPILRDFFWFLVLPYQFGQFLQSRSAAEQEGK